MKIKFKDRFNRKFIRDSDFMYEKIVYAQVVNLHIFNRDNLPSSVWLDGDIIWRNTKLKRHCTTGPSVSMIDGEIAYAINNRYMTKMEWLLAIE